MAEIGLFPLEMVLLPGEQRPLHIFEPRYRELIGECLERGGEFGLVLADDEGIRPVGTSTAVVEVLARYDDGRFDVVVEGRSRFRIVEVTEGRSFVTADVEPLADEPGPAATEEEAERALAAYGRVLDAAQTDVDAIEPGRGDLAFQIATRVDLGNEVKQSLLESTSEQERLARLEGLLDRAAEAVGVDREIRGRASGNGRVEPLP